MPAAHPTHRRMPRVVTWTIMMVMAVSVGFSVLSQAQAQSSVEGVGSVVLTAIPPRLGDDQELKAKPGEKIQTAIRVRNSSDKPLAITSSAIDFIIGEDGETPLPVTDATSNRWSLASWITLAPATQVVQPRETATINIVITVPDDALPGGHYAMVMHEPSENLNLANGQAGVTDAGSQARVAQRVGTLLYFMVDGPINEEAFIRGFDFAIFTEYGPVPFSYSVENMSDIHIKPAMKIEIFNLLGQKVDEITPESKNVFPLMSRSFEGEWNRVWGIGLYTAKMTLSFGSTGQVVLAKDAFWLIPYKLVLAAIVILVAILGLIVVIRRHMHHRQGLEKARIQELEQKVQELESNKHQEFNE